MSGMDFNGVALPQIDVPVAEMARIPVVHVAGAGLRVQEGADGKKLLLIGPIVLGIPVSKETQQWIRDQLSPIVVASAADMPREP